jgi:LemA protein
MVSASIRIKMPPLRDDMTSWSIWTMEVVVMCLIPNLVDTVKGYAKHERATLEQVIALRNQCRANNGSPGKQASTETLLVSSLSGLFALSEGYPELKADRNFLELQKELVNTEDRIQAARRFYNGNVRDYRNRAQSFPANLVAGLFGFPAGAEEFFEVEPVERKAPKLKM